VRWVFGLGGRSGFNRLPWCDLLFAVVVTEGFEELEAEFKKRGSDYSRGIEPEHDREDGGFGDRHPCVFSIEVGLVRRSHDVISGCLWTPVMSLKGCMCWG
jgi:hypothetical protein